MNMICDAQDSPGNKLTFPTSSKFAPVRAAGATIADGRALSGSPQLTNTNAAANESDEHRRSFIPLNWMQRHVPHAPRQTSSPFQVTRCKILLAFKLRTRTVRPQLIN